MYIPKIILIAAHDDNNGIGFQNKLPWNNKADMQHFKDTTEGHIVIMGRKTMGSLPKRHLSDRLNIVLSKTVSDNNEPFISYDCPDKALVYAKKIAGALSKDIFIIGGAEIYRAYEQSYSHAILTHVHGQFEVDAYLPVLAEMRSPDCAEDEQCVWTAETFKTRRQDTESGMVTFRYYARYILSHYKGPIGKVS